MATIYIHKIHKMKIIFQLTNNLGISKWHLYSNHNNYNSNNNNNNKKENNHKIIAIMI